MVIDFAATGSTAGAAGAEAPPKIWVACATLMLGKAALMSAAPLEVDSVPVATCWMMSRSDSTCAPFKPTGAVVAGAAASGAVAGAAGAATSGSTGVTVAGSLVSSPVFASLIA